MFRSRTTTSVAQRLRFFSTAPSQRIAQETNPYELFQSIISPNVGTVPKVPVISSSALLPSVKKNVTVLENGLRVVSEEAAGDMATVSVWIDAGSRYETERTNGVAHFLEHMAFKGTGKRSQFDIETEVENMGAHLNAYTSREHTTYLTQTFKSDIAQGVDILSDILLNSKYDEAAIERERDVILRESEEVDLQYNEIVFDKLHQMAFRGSSLGRAIIGTEHNVKTLGRDDLVNFVKTHYTADRIVVSAAGAVDHEALCKIVAEKFAACPTSGPSPVSNGGKPYFIGSDVRMREDEMDEVHFGFAFESLPWSHPDSLTLSVMVALLGVFDKNVATVSADTAGKLARGIAEEDLASVAMPFNTPYADTGLFGVYCVGNPEKLPELTWQAQEEVTRMCYEVDEDDVRRAVNQTKANIAAQLDGSMLTAEDMGRQMLTLGRVMSLKETFDRLDRINASEIKRLANNILNDRDLVVASIGPVKMLPDYNRFRRRTFWLRY